MDFFLHKNRHVVVSNSEQTQDGKVSVKWVDFGAGVEGSHRRGRRPSYSEPVSLSELTPVDSTDELVAKATRVLSQSAAPASEGDPSSN